ncbi:CASP-like protein 4A3 [Impatiens glandulifera]|uniref:CASP-like protein 4A3 n=1 Tax=Impatiens glandulifera TaxID=253017 RepID=UPI001FB086BB|nr:CASP-like protein 4A3 [Impatiens glandulifera]
MESRGDKIASSSKALPASSISTDSSPVRSLSLIDSSPVGSLSPVTDDEPSFPPAISPTQSSLSSDLSQVSSISHGFSPAPRIDTPPGGNIPSIAELPPPPRPVMNRYVRDESPVMKNTADPINDGGNSIGRVAEGEVRSSMPSRPIEKKLSILKSVERNRMIKRIALGFRAWGSICCLISFSVMAANRKRGWALDSFEKYKEFRYCITMNIVGFVYSSFQMLSLSYHLATGKYVSLNHLRYYIDFLMDQILAYLLISASSSAVTRVDDWESNWGKDKFPTMASASVGMSYLGFVAMAVSSLISGYTLFTSSKSTL